MTESQFETELIQYLSTGEIEETLLSNGVSQIEIDLDDGRHVFLTVFDQKQVGTGDTVYQVVNQIRRPAVIAGKKERCFDTTLLINGLLYMIQQWDRVHCF